MIHCTAAVNKVDVIDGGSALGLDIHPKVRHEAPQLLRHLGVHRHEHVMPAVYEVQDRLRVNGASVICTTDPRVSDAGLRSVCGDRPSELE